MTFRCNLFKHIGRLSALREKEQIDYAPYASRGCTCSNFVIGSCFHRMNASVVFWVSSLAVWSL